MEKISAEKAIIFVEGKKDEAAIAPYVRGTVIQVSGRVRGACERAAEKGAREVIVLTDRDSAGEELAELAKEELEFNGIKADLETRKKLFAILRMGPLENFRKKYEEKMEELAE
jgi:5S rRNA maturation endonuclease (ribonuclease M5)